MNVQPNNDGINPTRHNGVKPFVSPSQPLDDYPFDFEMVDELPKKFVPPDELVQGLLTTNALSVLYGRPNTGKTNVAIDMAAAISRGADWMGRRTER